MVKFSISWLGAWVISSTVINYFLINTLWGIIGVVVLVAILWNIMVYSMISD